MAIARHEQGVRGDLAALASQVHPVFMLPPLAASWFGAVLAPALVPRVAFVHMLAMFFAVYTAHVKDGYVDFYVRSEDDDHPLTMAGCRLGLILSTVGFVLCTGWLWLAVGSGAALVTLPTWLVAYFHAPQLDMHPIGATLGYPLGIALAILGGYYAQTTAMSAPALAFAAVFLVLLSGIKVIDDAKDYDYDRSIRKRTVAVALGQERARRSAHLLIALALVGTLAGAFLGLFPPSTALAAVAFGAVALVTRRFEPRRATKLLMRGSYVFLGLLFLAVLFHPLS
ncbi:UbiA family prenyltransferase [Halococcus sediminicola]|uniref:UbiA family prenyltransferase n=1 Tax=Halococcus sediminicola TaxID=1264579 RepID=UPI000678D17D|nr:UbiA family prenyltransferase [Halococcus sediminicola]